MSRHSLVLTLALALTALTLFTPPALGADKLGELIMRTAWNGELQPEPEPAGPVFLPPEGFEDLIQPSEIPVDIHLDGVRIGSAFATVEPGSLIFSDPDAIVQMIEGLNEKALVRRALTGELDANEAFACNPLTTRRCERLEPDIAAIIFRPERFIVDIILAPELLTTSEPDARPFTETPRSLMFGIDAVSSTSLETDTNDFSINLAGSFGGGPAVFTGDMTLNSAIEGARVNNLLFRRFSENRTVSAGLLNDVESPTFSLPRFLGLRWGPREDLRDQRGLRSAPPIRVNLDGQGRVEIFDGEILLDVQSFDGGIAAIDPRTLPTGARDLTLRITDSSGQRTETRFYARGGDLAPFGAPQFSFELGALLDHSLADSNQFLGAGLGQTFARAAGSYRVRSDLSISASAIAASDVALFDANLVWQRSQHEVRASARVSDEGEQGFRVSVSTRIGQATLGGSISHVERPTTSASRSGDYLPAAFSGLTFNAGTPVGEGNLLAFASTRTTPDGETTYNWQVQYNAPLGRRGPARSGFWTASISGQNDSLAARVGLRFQFGASPNRPIRHTASTEVLFQDDDRAIGARAQLNSTYERRRSASSSERYTSRLQLDDQDVRGDLEAVIVRPEFRAELEVAARNGTEPEITGRLRTGFAAAQSGAVADTGRRGSGVIVALDGDEGSGSADIIVNRQRFASIEVGERAFVPVTPFRSTQIGVLPRDSAWVNYDPTVQEVRLWPGSIASVRRTFASVRTVFGQLVSERGEPLPGATILDAPQDAQTDSQGWFQSEITGASVRFQLTDGSQCEIRLAPDQTQGPIVNLGVSTCINDPP